MMFVGLFWLIVLVVLVRWLASDQPERLPPGWTRHTDAELTRLREEVDRLSGQVDRLLDEQSFLLRLLDGDDAPRRLTARGDPPERSEGENPLA